MIELPVHNLDIIPTPTTTAKDSQSAENSASTQQDSQELQNTSVYVFGAKANVDDPQSGDIPSATSAIKKQSTVRADPKKDSRPQKKTAEEQLREKRERIRASIQDRRMMGDDDDFPDDPDESNCIQMGAYDDPRNTNQWTHIPTVEERAIKKAQKEAELLYRDRRGGGPLGAPRGPQGFQVELEPVLETDTFVGCNFLKLFQEVRSTVIGAGARILPRGSLMISVPSQDDIAPIKATENILGIPVRPCLPAAAQPWGRIGGVHPMFQEKDLLDTLRSQGVEKVVREKYTVKTVSDGKNVKAERPSQRVRLLFSERLPDLVTIAFESYRVTWCPASPLQCLTCCKFGHTAASCPKAGQRRCRRCGELGHEMWECERKARCINCKGSHPANHRSCPVYATHAKAASERSINRLVTSIAEARIEDVSIVPAVPPAESSPDGAEKPSFAAVVGAPSFRKVVKKTDEGDVLICNVPIVPTRAKPSRTTAPKKQSKSLQPACPSGQPAGVSAAGILHLIRNLWVVVKPLIDPLLAENPTLGKLIDILVSDSVLQLILQSVESGILNMPTNV